MLLTEWYLLGKGWLKHRRSQMVFHLLKSMVKIGVHAMLTTVGYLLQTGTVCSRFWI
jgi:hypothetical protein